MSALHAKGAVSLEARAGRTAGLIRGVAGAGSVEGASDTSPHSALPAIRDAHLLRGACLRHHEAAILDVLESGVRQNSDPDWLSTVVVDCVDVRDITGGR